MSSSLPTDLFPDRLKQARKIRKLNQEALAERAQLQPSAISHFETGARKPSFDNLRRLADALEVTTDYLLGRVPDMQGPVGADKLHRNLEQLSAADRDIAEEFLRVLAERRQREDD